MCIIHFMLPFASMLLSVIHLLLNKIQHIVDIIYGCLMQNLLRRERHNNHFGTETHKSLFS